MMTQEELLAGDLRQNDDDHDDDDHDDNADRDDDHRPQGEHEFRVKLVFLKLQVQAQVLWKEVNRSPTEVMVIIEVI